MEIKKSEALVRGSRRRRFGRAFSRVLATVTAAFVFVTGAAVGGVLPAAAMEGASLLVVKTVDGLEAKRDLRPGDSVVYRVEFRVNDEDADDPVRVADVLPAEFAGWQISDMTAVVGGTITGVSLDLPGVTSGPSPSAPVGGTIGSSAADRTITVGVSRPVQTGAGNTTICMDGAVERGCGMSTRDTGVLEYTITVPSGLSPYDPILRTDLTNTVTFSAKAGVVDLSTSDFAIISVDNPITVDVTPAKSWNPAAQSFEPGATSTIVIGGTQASNVNATSLQLQDPADPALTPANATALPAGNLFAHVDFAGFTAPGNPETNLPTGATSASVEVYRLSGGLWNWEPWSAAIPNNEIAGVRTTYAGDIPPNASVSQGFNVVQRATNRVSGASISTGYDLENEVRATVTVPEQAPVSKTTTAPFEVTPEQIDVSAQKAFYTLPAGTESVNLTGVTAGDAVGVVIRAINNTAPHSTGLDSLMISEPGTGSNSLFLGTDLIFDGFDMSTPAKIAAVWPTGATAATLTWQHAGGPTAVALNAGDPLPAPPAGQTITGFEIEFTGAGTIAAGAVSEIHYVLETNADEAFVADGTSAGPFTNAIDVVGERSDLDPDTANATARLSLIAPSITVDIDKRIGPGLIMPGQEVIVQLDTVATASGGRTKPTTILVEDVWDTSDADNFWNAFDVQEVLPPISRPMNGATQADLTISYRDAGGNWVVLATNPAEFSAISIPAGATGVRFEYENLTGLSQTTYVKPNLSFTARSVLRSDGTTPTAGEFTDAAQYTNVAETSATGMLDTRVVSDTDEDDVLIGVRGTESGTGPGPGSGGLWAEKQWADRLLTSQSGAASSTTQYWSNTGGGFERVELQDPAIPTATGAGTVFEAFNLTQIRPIRTTGAAGSGTVDPMLQWDDVVDVQLFDGATWQSVTPIPGGSWMQADGGGFKGYSLTAAERASIIGVRLVLEENGVARAAAAASGDLTAPAVGAGVAASADIRSFRLDWQLRETARPSASPPKWVKENGTVFNCGIADEGCVNNVYGVTGYPASGPSATVTANDTIQLIDGVTNVDLDKQVRPLPISASTPSATSITMVAPNPGELAQADYPRARYTLSAENSSESPVTPEGAARGASKLAKIRVTDTSTNAGLVSSSDIHTSPFAGRDFETEVASAEGNHFDNFTLTGVSFGTLPSYIDTAESEVELWLFGAPGGTPTTFTLQQVLSSDATFIAALPYAIGVSVTYSGDDPENNGNRIVVGDALVMHLDVQLRENERFSGDPVEVGSLEVLRDVPNEAVARGWDAVVDPNAQPTNTGNASIGLTRAEIRVDLDKAVSVSHGGTSNQTIYETDPQAPVSVVLTASSEDSGGNRSTAPINDLQLQDRTPSFWDRFEFVSFGTATNPSDADRATLKVYVGGAWQNFVGYTGDLEDIRGVGVVFDRADSGLFPLGATSWNASWGTAVLPFTVQLREDATVDWAADTEDNTATVIANNTVYGSDSADADDAVTFSRGVHSILVSKRAPNDTSTHQIDALAALPWSLIFTNTGSSFLPITNVVDELPASLDWDGEDPVVTVTSPSGTPGLTETPDVELAADGRSLTFTWPAGSRMDPGETVEISLNFIMQPLALGQRATNSVVVTTDVPLASCEQPTTFGQDPTAPTVATECSNNNYVQPRAGTVIGARKTVIGEHIDTLGENLVTGALDVRTNTECEAGYYLPIGTDYTRNPCASYSTVGATDTWKLENINSGTAPLARMVVVDMLPVPGDMMLAGGAPRTSTFTPVLKDTSNIRVSGLPAGASYLIEVTTNPAACVGSTPGSSLWVADPECSNTVTNPANVWVALASYTGPVEDIAGLRVSIDMSSEPLPPAGNIVIEFETVNRVVDVSATGLKAELVQFENRQFAWNQNGAIAWDTAGNRVNLPAAPQRAGVTLMTGSLVVTKEVDGAGAASSPASFPVALECTVPSGVASPERVPFDLGAKATLTVPKGGSVTLDGLPIGTDCTIREVGSLGAHGEIARAIAVAPGVVPAADGLSAAVGIRMQPGGEDAVVALMNTYPLPKGIPVTGAGLPLAGWFGGGALALLLIGGGLLLGRKRRGAHS